MGDVGKVRFGSREGELTVVDIGLGSAGSAGSAGGGSLVGTDSSVKAV